MNPNWKLAAIGAAGGAAIAVAIVFGSAFAGLLPVRGEQIRSYMLAHPTLVLDMMTKVQAQQAADADRTQADAVRRAGLASFFDPKVAYVTGPADARQTLVEFFDYNCVHCRNSLAAIKTYYAAHKADTRFAFVDFPIFGAMSDASARAAVAARRQGDKYVAFSFALMGEKSAIDMDTIYADAKAAGLDIPRLIADMKDPETDRTLARAHALARRINIDGTPTFIANGRFHAGELDDDGLRDLMAGKDI